MAACQHFLRSPQFKHTICVLSPAQWCLDPTTTEALAPNCPVHASMKRAKPWLQRRLRQLSAFLSAHLLHALTVRHVVSS